MALERLVSCVVPMGDRLPPEPISMKIEEQVSFATSHNSSSCELFKHTKLVEDEADGLTALLVAGQWGDIGAIAEILENRPVGGQKILKAAKTAMKILDAPSVDDDQAAQEAAAEVGLEIKSQLSLSKDPLAPILLRPMKDDIDYLNTTKGKADFRKTVGLSPELFMLDVRASVYRVIDAFESRVSELKSHK